MLDSELASLESRLEQQENLVCQNPRTLQNDYGHDGSHGHWVSNSARLQAETQVTTLKDQISRKKTKIKTTEIPPAHILQPLPDEVDLALPIIFFLIMPQHFQVLSRMSFTAQQMLVPSQKKIQLTETDTIDINQCIATKAAPTDWRTYYSTTCTARSNNTPVTTKVLLKSRGDVETASEFPQNVRHFTIRADRQAVWYPDELEPMLEWTVGSFKLDARDINPQPSTFNPFAISDKPQATVHKFTETLPEELCTMQWAVPQYGRRANEQPSDRGNLSIARQDHGADDGTHSRPTWLTKVQYHSFSNLRAYPCLQIRKLCVAWHEQSLPWGHPAVRTLVQQALFQLGDISDSSASSGECFAAQLLWKTDLFSTDGWNVLHQELAALAQELKSKPREERSLLILGLAAAWSSQWDDISGCESRAIARSFANITREWADDLGEQQPEQDDVADQRARRCAWYMCALVCHGTGELSEEDVGQLCDLVLLANYTRLFEETTQHDDEVRRLEAMVHAVMARRLPELLGALDGNARPLTSAVKLILQQAPDDLDWQPVCFGGGTGCFEAIDGKHLYSVNVQTGVVLLDGLPPRRLPLKILSQPMYKRSFGKHNFEVVPGTEIGALQTIQPFDGKFYEFLDSSDRFVVREMCGKDRDPMEDLELLDGCDSGIQIWGSDLPVRLKEMHSHWYVLPRTRTRCAAPEALRRAERRVSDREDSTRG